MQAKKIFFVILIITFSDSLAFIIPNELPTILSLVYSNIPPLKIGSDNRFGIGFRLGPHADFQTLIELGPQIQTGKIAEDTPAKRDSPSELQANPVNIVNIQENKEELKKEVVLPSQDLIPINENQKPKKIPPKKTSPFLEKIVFTKVPGIDD